MLPLPTVRIDGNPTSCPERSNPGEDKIVTLGAEEHQNELRDATRRYVWKGNIVYYCKNTTSLEAVGSLL